MVNVVRQNPYTANLPIAANLAADFYNFTAGMQLVDWEGFHNYNDSPQQWQSTSMH